MADQEGEHDRDLQRTVVTSTFCSADVQAEYVWQRGGIRDIWIGVL